MRASVNCGSDKAPVSNERYWAAMPPEVVFLCCGLVIFGMLIGRSLAGSHPLAAILVGGAGIAALLLFLMAASGQGCSGGTCVGLSFAIAIVGPVGLIGAGILIAGVYVSARSRWLSPSVGLGGRVVSVTFWSLPVAALLWAGIRIGETQTAQTDFARNVSASEQSIEAKERARAARTLQGSGTNEPADKRSSRS